MAGSAREFQPPDGGYGWIIIIAGIVINTSLAPLMQCFGIIFEQQFQELNISAAKISFLLHLNNFIMCGLGLITGPLLKKYSFRQIAFTGSFLVCVGITLTTFANTYQYLIVTVCFLIGVGNGILMPATAFAINTYFKERVTLAMSFSVTGVGLLPIVTPQLCNILLNIYGTKGTILIFAAVSFHAFSGALLLRPLKKIDKNGIQIKNKRSHDEEDVCSEKPLMEAPSRKGVDQRRCSKLFAFFDLGLFKERTYVVIIIGMATSYVAELNFTLITPFVLAELADFSRTNVALFMSIQAAADISGRLFIPLISHKNGWSSKVMYTVSLIGSSVGRTVLAIFANNTIIVLSSSILLGLSKGSKAVYQSLILPEHINLERLPSAMGFLMVLNGILSICIGPLIGIVHDLSESYEYALHTASCISVICVALWTIDGYMLKRSTLNLDPKPTDIDS